MSSGSTALERNAIYAAAYQSHDTSNFTSMKLEQSQIRTLYLFIIPYAYSTSVCVQESTESSLISGGSIAYSVIVDRDRNAQSYCMKYFAIDERANSSLYKH